MRLTLLEMVQTILASMDSDEVNSITDTTESSQVAQIIKHVYLNILARADLPEHRQLFSLVSSTDTNLPVVMFRPEEVNRIEWIKYLEQVGPQSSNKNIHDINLHIIHIPQVVYSNPQYKYLTFL